MFEKWTIQQASSKREGSGTSSIGGARVASGREGVRTQGRRARSVPQMLTWRSITSDATTFPRGLDRSSTAVGPRAKRAKYEEQRQRSSR